MNISVSLTYVRSTKGLLRYEEEVPKGKHPLVGVLYVTKEWFDGKAPKVLRLTVTAEEKQDAEN